MPSFWTCSAFGFAVICAPWARATESVLHYFTLWTCSTLCLSKSSGRCLGRTSDAISCGGIAVMIFYTNNSCRLSVGHIYTHLISYCVYLITFDVRRKCIFLTHVIFIFTDGCFYIRRQVIVISVVDILSNGCPIQCNRFFCKCQCKIRER